jgi:hypothetical protein
VTPENVASLLLQTKGLKPERIVEFLSHRSNSHYLRQFFRTIPLRTSLIEAMRRSLCGPYVMPDKARDIDRALAGLAEAYFDQNEKVFANAGDVLYLAYAYLMLNTELQRPNAPDQMTCQTFLEVVGNAIGHSRIPRDHLARAYSMLQQRPFSFPPKPMALMANCAPRKRGWLRKKNTWGFGAFTANFFLLKSNELLFFENVEQEKAKNPLGKIALTDVNISEDPRAEARFYMLPRKDQITYFRFNAGQPEPLDGIKAIVFEARTTDIASQWVVRLRKAAIMAHFIRGLSQNTEVTITRDDTSE